MNMLSSAARRAAAGALLALALVAPGAYGHHPVEDHGVAVAAQAPANAPEETHRGIVRDLTIEDRVAGMTFRYLGLDLADGKVLSLRGEGLAALSAGMQIQATGQRDGAVLFVSGWHPAAAFGSHPAPSMPKTSASVSGKLLVLHSDDFDTGRSEYLYEVEGRDGALTRVKLGVVADALHPGMQVSVDGLVSDDGTALEASRITIHTLAKSAQERAAVAKAVTNNSVLFILIKFTDSPSTTLTQAQVQTATAGGPGSGSVAEYYKEASYGQQLMNVTVTPWLASTSATPANCNFTSMGSLANTAATNAGYNPNSYNFIVYVFPRVSSCGWSGLAYVGYPHKAWINGNNSVQVYTHEMGHNFGLLHAASIRCTGGYVGSGCSSSEYGDPFDTMGNQRAMHFNAVQKDLLGWFAPTAVATHTAGTATYVLTPMSVAGGSLYGVST